MTSTLPHRLRRTTVTPPCPFPRQRPGATVDPAPSTPYLELDVPRRCRPLRRAGRGTARHSGALRREGQPAPPAARRAGRRRLPVRRRQPGRGARRAARGRRARGPRLLQPGQAPRPHRRGRRPSASGCSSSTRSPRPTRSRRQPRAAQVLCRLVTSGDGSDWPLSRKYGCSTYEAVEVLTLRRRARPRRRRRVLPRRFPAARPGGLGRHRSLRRHTSSSCCASAVCAPGCSTWAAASRRRTTTAAGRSRRTARPSTATSTVPSATDRPETIIEPGRGDRRRRRDPRLLGHRRGRARRRALGLPRRRRLHRSGGDARTRRSATGWRPRPTAVPPDRACWPGPTCDSADVLYEDRMVRAADRPSPRATRCGCCRPAPTPAATRAWASTASPRCPPGPGRPDVRHLDARHPAGHRSHAIAALAVSLPWPLLLVLVAEQHRRPAAPRAGRQPPGCCPTSLLSWVTAPAGRRDATRPDRAGDAGGARGRCWPRRRGRASTDHVWLAVAAARSRWRSAHRRTRPRWRRCPASPARGAPATDLLVTVEVAAFVVGARARRAAAPPRHARPAALGPGGDDRSSRWCSSSRCRCRPRPTSRDGATARRRTPPCVERRPRGERSP